MVRREFTPEKINEIANDPDVKEGARIQGEADFTEIVRDIRNVVLTFGEGGFVLFNKGNGVYEIHTLAKKEARGRALIHAVSGMFHYIFFETDCERLVSIAYKDNEPAVALASKYLHQRGETEDYYYYDLDYLNWVERSESARESGEKFHEKVETDHDDDPIHDYHVGGALILLENGNIGKAMTVYNKWAVMSGYEQASLLNAFPLVLQLGEMRLIHHNGSLEEIPCL